MKLGIVVVYLVNDEDEKLLDLHLGQIARHTSVPYTIYGCINRLLPKFRQKLEQHSRVKTFRFGATDLRGDLEHAFYLERLVKIAIEDGVSHVVILHVDSFPVSSAWVQGMAGKLSDSCALVAVRIDSEYWQGTNTACMLFHRDFYLKYNPRFLLSDKELSSTECEQYFEEIKQIYKSNECGGGFGFKIYLEGLSWLPMIKSNKGGDINPKIGSLYDDLIFHLGSASHSSQKHKESFGNMNQINGSLFDRISFSLLLFFRTIKKRLNRIIPKYVRHFLIPIGRVVWQYTFRLVKWRLLKNPDSYINYIRTGERDQLWNRYK